MAEIGIVPVNAIDASTLTRLAMCLEERFLYTCVVRAPVRVPRTALNAVRGQLFLGSLVQRLSASNDGPESLVLGVTDYDLYKTSHQFVFGGSSQQHRVAALSLHRLRSEFYGEPRDDNALFQRVLKEAIHEIGHALGLPRCANARCAMSYSTSVFDTDNKHAQFCEACEKRGRARR